MSPGEETLWNKKSKPKILIVDDMPENLELIEAYLSVEPYDVITARDERL